ncbi:hypothetical protein [Trinickia dinghuensis]|uniref:Uncharacterized protein n=1 Tax=Trinickia dinghuensis TaxID=2291023 RepID=A0A3D8JTB9_9BURK|nr:hypothetical protein [Trinickia dinghuensis]RDU95906.1 hypothetical protein DWV00_27075 [Trinickia dinghuensis]
MNIEEIAREAGMQVVLDGRIGRQEYKSVYGTLQALRRFADSICELTAGDMPMASDGSRRAREELS